MLQIPAGLLIDAAEGLKLAGRWGLAGELLAAASAGSPGERAAVAMTKAAVAVDADFWHQTAAAGPAVEEAEAAVVAAGPQDPELATAGFDLELLRVRQAYFAELSGPDGPRFGPGGRDPAVLGELAGRAGRLRDSAPGRRRAGAAAFLAGLIEDNLRGDAVAARALFTEAVQAGEETGDDLLTAEALRHLGAANDQAGDTALAREQWRRATGLRQRAGCVPLTLAQQLLVAQMTAGDDPAALLVAAEVRRWAAALGIPLLEASAAALLTGADG